MLQFFLIHICFTIYIFLKVVGCVIRQQHHAIKTLKVYLVFNYLHLFLFFCFDLDHYIFGVNSIGIYFLTSCSMFLFYIKQSINNIHIFCFFFSIGLQKRTKPHLFRTFIPRFFIAKYLFIISLLKESVLHYWLSFKQPCQNYLKSISISL